MFNLFWFKVNKNKKGLILRKTLYRPFFGVKQITPIAYCKAVKVFCKYRAFYLTHKNGVPFLVTSLHNASSNGGSASSISIFNSSNVPQSSALSSKI